MGLFGRKSHREEPQMIDLREPARDLPEFGMPTRCPACGANGYLDKLDLVHEVMFQHCPSCFTRWETTAAELQETSASA